MQRTIKWTNPSELESCFPWGAYVISMRNFFSLDEKMHINHTSKNIVVWIFSLCNLAPIPKNWCHNFLKEPMYNSSKTNSSLCNLVPSLIPNFSSIWFFFFVLHPFDIFSLFYIHLTPLIPSKCQVGPLVKN